MKDKFIYKVFHLDGDTESLIKRDDLFNNIKWNAKYMGFVFLFHRII